MTFPGCTTRIPNAKILHLRASGRVIQTELDHDSSLTAEKMECLNQFAQWAFSAEGYPELQVLAHGDFSYDNHYQQYNLLLRRVGYTYRELGSMDSWHWDLVRDNMDALAACAYDELIVGRAIPTA